MTEQNQAQNLLVTMRDALHQLEGALERTRAGIDDIANQTERLRAGVEALGEIRIEQAGESGREEIAAGNGAPCSGETAAAGRRFA